MMPKRRLSGSRKQVDTELPTGDLFESYELVLVPIDEFGQG